MWSSKGLIGYPASSLGNVGLNPTHIDSQFWGEFERIWPVSSTGERPTHNRLGREHYHSLATIII